MTLDLAGKDGRLHDPATVKGHKPTLFTVSGRYCAALLYCDEAAVWYLHPMGEAAFKPVIVPDRGPGQAPGSVRDYVTALACAFHELDYIEPAKLGL